ncbi:MAG: hypothetical protein ACTSP1_05285 [Candidatus Freyarchaeota archaeon]
MNEKDSSNVSGEEMFRIVNDLCSFGYRRAGRRSTSTRNCRKPDCRMFA